MSLKRFNMISRAVRFDDRSTRAERRIRDKLAPIREVWDRWVSILPKLYNPGEKIVVDKQLVAFRGRCAFRQYIPSKPAKYGIKIWVACDCRTSYAWAMQIYTGKLEGSKTEKNQGSRVVLDFSRGLSGHNITCDSFFTSYALGQKLLKKHITLLGTIRRHKPEIPPELLSRRDVHTSLFGFTSDTTIVSYAPKRNKSVLLMSTLHRKKEISDRADKKPEMILDYNKTKGGVDALDQQIGNYTCKRKTNRWPMVVFSNMVDVSAYNAFVIWQEIEPNYHKNKLYKRRLFLEELGYQLVKPCLENRTHQPRTQEARKSIASAKSVEGSSTSLGPGDVKKRSRCYKCSSKSDRKYNNFCLKCNRCICKKHKVSLCSDCA